MCYGLFDDIRYLTRYLRTREQMTDEDEVYCLFSYTIKIVLNNYIHPLRRMINEVDTFNDVHAMI